MYGSLIPLNGKFKQLIVRQSLFYIVLNPLDVYYGRSDVVLYV